VDVNALDTMQEAELRKLLSTCCAAPAWVDGMFRTRPWRSRDALLAAADRAWDACPPEAIADAIAHHPRLGERAAKVPLGEREQRWSAMEQKGAGVAAGDVREALARGNTEYEARFGHTFILCATGVSAEDMLRALEERLTHDAATEHGITARELHKITRLRLERLLEGDAQEAS
jgi:2-oxo-4-hydroxy-4-carboxy-5-ureidoimidazoline decarboxylase